MLYNSLPICYDASHEPFSDRGPLTTEKVESSKPISKVIRAVLRRLEIDASEAVNHSIHRCSCNSTVTHHNQEALDSELTLDQLEVKDGDAFFIRRKTEQPEEEKQQQEQAMSSLNPAKASSSSSLQKQQHPEAIPSQPFESLSDELLLRTFQHLTPFKRAQLLSTCKRWNNILRHPSLWQYLTVPKDLLFHRIFAILLAFTDRSGSKLKHVIIESKIHHEHGLGMIFSVLEKSASSLKFLALNQDNSLNSKTRKLAMKHLSVLDSLITESGLESFQDSVRYLLSRRPKYGIQDQDDESNSGLRMYVTDYLSELLEEDIEWLSHLTYLQVMETCSTETLISLLEKCQDLMELDLTRWQADEEILEEIGPDPPFDFRRARIRLQNLKDLALPLSKTSALFLGLLLQLSGSEVILLGSVPSLNSFKSFNLLSPKNLYVYLVHQASLPRQGYKSLKDFETAIMTLFEKNQIVKNVSVDCPDDDASAEEKKYFKAILEKLCLRANAGEPKLERGKGQDRVERNVHQFFPFMTRLDVREPSPFAQVLLKKVLQSRREHSPDFQLRAMDELGDEVSDWEGRSW